MAKSHHNCYLAITNKCIEIVSEYDIAKEKTNGRLGGRVKGFNSSAEAQAAIEKERNDIKTRLSKKRRTYSGRYC